ncbi:DC-STAMP domain-containing protein 2 [Lucilia sericata]|uniref:DC-STAMP domain-containing protein 2 n=1 Tax=Lucilia sericata TaxID=13632 RepID=UPI0018A7F4FF|nr:DC-STAMP domain-containing protein 2 [Lucilia sericata]
MERQQDSSKKWKMDVPEQSDNANTKNQDNKKVKETFFGRIFRKIIDSGIPIKKALNLVFFGYVFGIILTIIWYNYVTKEELNTLRWICFIVIGFIVLLLSYSMEVRCTVTLAIPILCSSKGRSVIIAVGFFLAATGPTVNIFHNIDVMVTSLTCGQMQLKEALSEMLDALKKPLVAIKEAIRNAINDLRNVLKKVQVVLLRIEELVIIILASIKNAFAWLENIVKMCNTKFGTPYERCMDISKLAMQDCRAKLGPIKGICRVTHVFSMLCYTAKIVDVICVLVDFVNYAIIAKVMEKLAAFVGEIKKLFDVSITFDHDFYFQTTTSKELQQVKTDIMADIHRKMRTFVLIFGWLDLMSLVLLIVIVIKAIYFRLKYIHNLGYQNNYITNEFLEIDEKRKSLQMETVLPLTFTESFKYPGLTDCRLTKQEWLGIAQSSMFLIISTIQLFCICFADYCLFWILAMISFYGHKELGFEVPPYITVEVEGGGFVGEIFRGIVHAFEPISQNYTMDSKTCLPNPRTPYYAYYYLITMIIITAWIFLFCQPYGLRLRHIVMRLYYPEVARQRAAWLHSKILLKRMSFFKLARRKARLLFKKNSTIDNVSCLDWLRAQTDQYCICRFILGQRSKDKCILCGIPLDSDLRKKCETVGCSAIYCKNCFKESLSMCCLCNNPVEYGDFSDISEVEDSSDDPDAIHYDETDEYCAL